MRPVHKDHLYLFDLGYWAFRLFERICAIVAVAQSECAHLIGKRLSEGIPLLADQTELDVTIQLSKAQKPRWTRSLRLVGLWHEGVWRF